MASRLLAAGASVTAYDPTVEPGDESKAVPDGVRVVGDPLQASTDAAVLAVMTEWDQFRWVDLHRVAKAMTGDAVIDGRNLLNPTEVRAAGLSYDGIGRS